LVPPEIIPPLPDEPRQTQVALASTPQGLSLQYILADLTEDDAVIPTSEFIILKLLRWIFLNRNKRGTNQIQSTGTRSYGF
jgi:hypothetical protein